MTSLIYSKSQHAARDGKHAILNSCTGGLGIPLVSNPLPSSEKQGTMENQYGITITNKYQLFLDDDDSDPLEILRQQEEAKQQKKREEAKGNKKDVKNDKSAKSVKNRQNKKVAAAQEEQKPKLIEESAPRREEGGRPRGGFQKREGFRERGENDRGGRTFRNTNRGEVPPRRERQMNQEGEKSPEFRERNDWPEGERGRGRGGFRRGGRGGRGRGGFDRFGKREFERHSGSDRTGIKPTEKREGGGAHNWGTIKDDLEEQLNEANTSKENLDLSHTEDSENQDPNREQKEEDKEEEQPQEEEQTREMTLDEWKALQKQERHKKDNFNIRRPNEGADESQWKKMHVLKKKEDHEEHEEAEEEEEDYEYEHKKKTVNIEITFADNPRRGGRGRRGGGGRGRGGRGRGGFDREGGFERRGGFGGGRGGHRREVAPDVANEMDFPSLGKASGL